MPFGEAFVYQAPKRKKSEVFWSGLTGPSAVLAADTDVELIAWVKAFVAPQFGTLSPFFNTTSNKLNAFSARCSWILSAPMATAWWRVGMSR